MNKTNCLVVDTGGRGGAVAWKLKRSPQAGTIYVAPGNPGTAMMGCQNIPLLPTKNNFDILGTLARQLNIGLAFIGPENALADGIVAALVRHGIPTFGPNSAIIESSKSFAKLLMQKVGIPTAPFEIFSDPGDALKYAREKNGRVVVKADGLASGKGVRVCRTVEIARAAIHDFMVKRILGSAGETVVIEDLLEGVELSIHALCDGVHVKLFPPVRDHKYLLDGNNGSMTGGMGVYGPIDVPPGLMEQIENEIVLPCVRGLAAQGLPFMGCLYPGLMLTKAGPMVLEFNARFGSPETQVYMPLMGVDVDLIEVLLACIHGRLDKVELCWKNEKRVCIVVAAHGYPDNPRTGDKISIYRFQESSSDPLLFHEGTVWSDGQLCTSEGRVLSLSRVIKGPEELGLAYGPLEERRIEFAGMQYRTDIGKVH